MNNTCNRKKVPTKHLISYYIVVKFDIRGCDIPIVENFQYLGIIISTKNSDMDINRQLRKLYSQINIVKRNFSFCSDTTKLSLFKSYCYNLCCSQFWFHYTKSVINKLCVVYNNGLRRLINIPYNNSASEMFVYLKVPSFGELARKNVLKFKWRTCTYKCF